MSAFFRGSCEKHPSAWDRYCGLELVWGESEVSSVLFTGIPVGFPCSAD